MFLDIRIVFFIHYLIFPDTSCVCRLKLGSKRSWICFDLLLHATSPEPVLLQGVRVRLWETSSEALTCTRSHKTCWQLMKLCVAPTAYNHFLSIQRQLNHFFKAKRNELSIRLPVTGQANVIFWVFNLYPMYSYMYI